MLDRIVMSRVTEIDTRIPPRSAALAKATPGEGIGKKTVISKKNKENA